MRDHKDRLMNEDRVGRMLEQRKHEASLSVVSSPSKRTLAANHDASRVTFFKDLQNSSFGLEEREKVNP